MKAVRLLLLLLLFSCTAEENEVPTTEVDNPEAAILEYPVNNSRCTEGENTTGDNTEIGFQWEPGDFTTSYKLFIVNLLTQAEQSFTTAENFYPVILERGTPYSWWVISYNPDTPEGTKSSTGKFYTTGDGITNYAPFAADLLAPSNGAAFAENTGRVKLEWQAEDVDGEELTYELYLSKNKDLSEAVHKSLSGNFYETNVEKKVTYYWKIIAKDPVGNTSGSDVSSFSILGEEEDNTGKSSEKKILSFSIEHDGAIYDGEIDHEARTIFLELDNFDYGALTPEIAISEAASVVPASGKSQNFLDDLYYKVTAEDGTEETYDIIVLSGQHEILDFEVHHEGNRYIGKVDAENAIVTIELGGNDFTAMKTFIKTSNRSTIDPPGGAVQNFNRDILYTVTSEKGTSKTFKVVAPIRLKQTFPFYASGGGGYEFTEETLNERFILYAGADLNFITVNFPDPAKVKLELVSTNGTPYPLQIIDHAFYHETFMEVSNTSHHFKTIIPNSLPSGTYTYRISDGKKEASYPHRIEIINDESTIRINSLNGEEFGYGDTLIVSGKNLTNTFYIFSDFSYYSFGDYNTNTALSEDKTEMRMEIDQNTYGNLSRGEAVKPVVFYNFVEGYEYPVLSNTAYFTMIGGW